MLTRKALALMCLFLLSLSFAASADSKHQAAATSVVSSPRTLAAGVPMVPSIARLVPAAIREHQPLVVPSDSDYPPLEYLAADGKTITGVSALLIRDIMATLGLKYRVAVVSFNSIIPGFAAGKYIISLAGVNVTPERAKVVDFVTYTQGGDQFIQAAEKNFNLKPAYSAICGHTVAVLAGSTQLTEVQKAAKKCAAHAEVLVFPTQNAVNLALKAGRADFGLVDNILPGYLSTTTHGQFKPASKAFNFTSKAGFAIKKGSKFAPAVHAALQRLIKTGRYHKIFAQWGITATELKSSSVVTH